MYAEGLFEQSVDGVGGFLLEFLTNPIDFGRLSFELVLEFGTDE